MASIASLGGGKTDLDEVEVGGTNPQILHTFTFAPCKTLPENKDGLFKLGCSSIQSFNCVPQWLQFEQ